MKVYGYLRATVVLAAALLQVAHAGSSDIMCEVEEPTPVPTPAATSTTSAPVTTTSAPVVTTAAPTNTPAPAPASEPTSAPTTAAPTEAPTETPTETPTEAPTEAPTSAASVTGDDNTQSTAGTFGATFSYTGADCGGPGSYNMVTDYATCATTTEVMTNPISPFDDDVTLVFRGPMNIYNIAVFDGSSGAWTKVSSYENGGSADNLVFMNNHNIDYAGQSSPEGYATADGKGTATEPTPFTGYLAPASDPNGNSIYADEKTGAEVHIMTSKKCGVDGECKGYYDQDGTAHIGWGGAKKIFITKVDMPHGGAPDLPAVWMLNAQIVRSNQYACNCRGMGKTGGCGELDIAEVLEKDTSKVATHYYFYEGGSAPGNDVFGDRPVDSPTTYVTIIDEDYGVKIVEIGEDDFDFGCGKLTDDVVKQWQGA